MFVPSSWAHVVLNLDDAISINHNWLNGCNVLHVYRSLRFELAAVERELQDCVPATMTSARVETAEEAEWAHTCQDMMRGLCGMSMLEFADLLHLASDAELAALDAVPAQVNLRDAVLALLANAGTRLRVIPSSPRARLALYNAARIVTVLADMAELPLFRHVLRERSGECACGVQSAAQPWAPCAACTPARLHPARAHDRARRLFLSVFPALLRVLAFHVEPPHGSPERAM